ncbi:MAG: hypothetical protein ACREE5_13230 [Acetobacteraceae bacterium]
MATIASSIASISSSLGMVLSDFSAAEHEALACCERRDHVDWRLAALLAAGPPRGLAVDRNHPLRHPGHRRHPGNEATLEKPGPNHIRPLR